MVGMVTNKMSPPRPSEGTPERESVFHQRKSLSLLLKYGRTTKEKPLRRRVYLGEYQGETVYHWKRKEWEGDQASYINPAVQSDFCLNTLLFITVCLRVHAW